MARTNILANISDKLNVSYYTSNEIKNIVLAIASFRNVSEDLRMFVTECFDVLQAADTTFKKTSLIDLCREVANDPTAVKYLRVSEGAQFCVNFTLNIGEDFTDSFLTARNREDDTLLSPDDIAGDSQVNAPVQEVEIEDLQLTAGSFYPVNYLTESDGGGGTASGEAGTLLAKYYFLVTKDIDAV